MKIFAYVLALALLTSSAALAAKKILYFTDGAVPTTNEQAAITKLQNQAAQPYNVQVRNSRQARTRGSHIETADYLAGASIPPNYRDGGVDVGTVKYPIFDPDKPPVPPAMPSTQAVFNTGDVIPLAGGGHVTLTITNHTATVSAYVKPDAGT